MTAPRITPADLQATNDSAIELSLENIVSEHYFTAGQGVAGNL